MATYKTKLTKIRKIRSGDAIRLKIRRYGYDDIIIKEWYAIALVYEHGNTLIHDHYYIKIKYLSGGELQSLKILETRRESVDKIIQ